MSSTILSVTSIPEVVTADQALTSYYPASQIGDTDPALWDVVVKIKTHTAGLGTLLVTVRYHDGEGLQDLNVALALTAGNYAIAAWPGILRSASQPVSVGYTFLAGLVSGSADSTINVRYS